MGLLVILEGEECENGEDELQSEEADGDGVDDDFHDDHVGLEPEEEGVEEGSGDGQYDEPKE